MFYSPLTWMSKQLVFIALKLINIIALYINYQNFKVQGEILLIHRRQQLVIMSHTTPLFCAVQQMRTSVGSGLSCLAGRPPEALPSGQTPRGTASLGLSHWSACHRSSVRSASPPRCGSCSAPDAGPPGQKSYSARHRAWPPRYADVTGQETGWSSELKVLFFPEHRSQLQESLK